MDIQALFQQLIILFTITFIGYFVRKVGLLGSNTNKVLSDLVINVSNPCSILASVMTGARILSNSEVWTLTAVAFAQNLIFILLSYGLIALVRAPKEERNLYHFMTVFANNCFMGFPVFVAVFGKEALFPAAIFVLVSQLFCYTYGIRLFEKSGFKLKSMVNPMIISIIVAFLIYMLKIPIPSVIKTITDTVAGITTPAAMICLGCALAEVPLKWVIKQGRLVVFNLIRLTTFPVLFYFLCKPWLTNDLMLGLTVATAALPIATNTNLMAARYDQKQGLAACGVFISTLLSVITMPLILGTLF